MGRFSAGVAFFQTSMPYGMTEPYGDTGESIYTQSGKQRNRGMELTFNGEILRGLRFNGGLTLIDAKQVHTAGGEYNGKTVIGVPNYTINGNLEYDVPFVKGLTLVGRVVSTGKQQFNNVNSAHLPAWSRFDLGARYTFWCITNLLQHGLKSITLETNVIGPLFIRAIWLWVTRKHLSFQ